MTEKAIPGELQPYSFSHRFRFAGNFIISGINVLQPYPILHEKTDIIIGQMSSIM